jgi:ATP-dependent Clp protease adaptor protein ClpS
MPDGPTTLSPPEAREDLSTRTSDGIEARVIVYNCDCHTYQQVIALFCRFIPGMSSKRAFELAYTIDHQGEAVVYAGDAKQAEEIGKALAGGGLRVAVQ